MQISELIRKDCEGKEILKAVVTKQIRWDNCEGGFATMANVGEVIAVTYHEQDSCHENSNYTAHFDMGSWVCSDYVSNDQVRVVNDEEAAVLDANYRRERQERLQKARTERLAREEIMYDTLYDDDFTCDD